ncbi:hypothetical protein SAMN05444169_8577 [Bradyrhizobium erythrophlei]|uniref:Uncharacterized protein n=1 Tax=Bradyrhizobium erythrophlei TaxID=1437360 RepID=A0A1M5UQG4_9BRAD|nr:hypothetical protein SAMN05444169_8577 [Bradyrhizobium erythrophlei]
MTALTIAKANNLAAAAPESESDFGFIHRSVAPA